RARQAKLGPGGGSPAATAGTPGRWRLPGHGRRSSGPVEAARAARQPRRAPRAAGGHQDTALVGYGIAARSRDEG
ncbi:MAG TPA: hypothetical protein VK458_32510, partial [Myxococcaceae bacterium]|nr:hypothetical protein [Myxococcaceae bacterium]